MNRSSRRYVAAHVALWISVPFLAGIPAAAGVETTGPAAAGDDAVDHVVAISIDGLNPTAIRQLGRSGAPNFYRMIDQGTGTLNARTMFSHTATLPNHVSMVTGRQVTQTGGHGVTFNTDNGSTVQATAGEPVASVFSVVHDAGGRTALYAAKTKFDLIDRSWNASSGEPDRVGSDQGQDKIDIYLQAEEQTLTAALRTQLTNEPPAFALLHLALPDSAGHAQGFMSDPYVTSVADVDVLLGQVLDTIETDPYLSSHTTVLLTADHGGNGVTHTDPRRRANYRIPFLTWGTGVAEGANLYVRNDDRRDPGRTRPSHIGKQPVRNAEISNLATDLLGLPAVPGSRFNPKQGLDVDRMR